MKPIAVLVVLVALCSAAGADPAPALEVHFSPNGGCAAQIIAIIHSAKLTVRQAAYAYTSVPIADAMIAAKRTGVDVQLVVDSAYAKGAQIQRLRTAGVIVFVDAKHGIFHDKYTIVDGVDLETGSYNYTAAAERSNAENCLVVRRAAALAKSYTADWASHAKHSTR